MGDGRDLVTELADSINEAEGAIHHVFDMAEDVMEVAKQLPWVGAAFSLVKIVIGKVKDKQVCG